MIPTKIKQIEANVIIELQHEGDGTFGQIHPFWECELSTVELHQTAVQLATTFAEEAGNGSVTYIIHDFRSPKE